jgi:hypothetical protein
MSQLLLRDRSNGNMEILQKWAQAIFARIDELQEERTRLLETDASLRLMDKEISNFYAHYQTPLVLVRKEEDGKRPAACSRATLLDTVELYIRSGGTLENLHPLSRLFSWQQELDLSY